MQIRVEPEQLRSAGSSLNRSAQQLQEISEHLNHLLASFSHENEAAWAALQIKWEQARRISEQVGNELYRLGENLKLRSGSFDETDRSFGSSISKSPSAYGPAASLYRSLRLGAESLILPTARFSPGIISSPVSAIEAVRREKREIPASPDNRSAQGFQPSPQPAAVESKSALPGDGKTFAFSGLSRKRNAERMLLKEAALNPQVWIFTNPAAGL